MVRPGLITGDQPVDAIKITVVKWTKQRLRGDEVDLRPAPRAVGRHAAFRGFLDANAHPYVRRPRQ